MTFAGDALEIAFRMAYKRRINRSLWISRELSSNAALEWARAAKGARLGGAVLAVRAGSQPFFPAQEHEFNII